MIPFALQDDHELLRDTVRKFALEVVRPSLRKWEREGAVPIDARRRYQALGLELVDVAESLGGVGAGALASVVLQEELACGDPAAAVALDGAHTASLAIAELGTVEQAMRLIGRLAEKGGVGAVAWSERGAPKDLPLAGFSTVARPTMRRGEAGYSLHGHKAFVSNAQDAALTVVFAQREGTIGWEGIRAFVVEKFAGAAPEGWKIGARHELLGLEAVEAFEVTFDGVFVPEGNLLDGGGQFLDGARRFLARLALTNAARQVGLARAAYEAALAYTQDRQAFGKAVAHFQSIAFTLAEMIMDVESARWLVWRAAVEIDQGHLDLAHIAAASAHANEAAFRVADNNVQLHGGAGFIQDFPAEKWLRDTRALALFAPSDELGALVIASDALGHALDAGLPSVAIQPLFT